MLQTNKVTKLCGTVAEVNLLMNLEQLIFSLKGWQVVVFASMIYSLRASVLKMLFCYLKKLHFLPYFFKYSLVIYFYFLEKCPS